MKIRQLLLGAILGALALPALAAPSRPVSGPWPYIAGQATYLDPDKARFIDDGFGATVLYGFPLNAYFAPEINLFLLNAGHKGQSGSDQQWGGGLDFAIYPIGRRAALSPFLLFGGGAQYEDRDVNRQSYGFADAGVGFLIPFNERRTLSFRVDAKHYWIFDSDTDPDSTELGDVRINAGLQYEFLKPDPAPEKAPAPAVAQGLPDSDGDGVPDHLDECPDTPRGVKVLPNGCALVNDCRKPRPGEAADANGCAIDKNFILKGVKFEFDSDRLTAEAKIILKDVAKVLLAYPDIDVEVQGHTDWIGSDAYNQGLSERRAISVKKFLSENGVTARRMTPLGFGESRPIETNETAEGRENNRRVELRVID